MIATTAVPRLGTAPPAGPHRGRTDPAAPAAAAAALQSGTTTQPGTLAVANAALRSGFVLLPRSILHAPGLSRDAKLLYAVLLSYAWQEGSCFPGYERLKADLQCGINQVTKYMVELEQAGLITRRRRGLGKTNLYTINDLPSPHLSHRIGDSGPAAGHEIHHSGETAITPAVNTQPPERRPEQDSRHLHTVQQPQERATPTAPQARTVPRTNNTRTDEDDVVALLLAHGVTKRVAVDLVSRHPAEAIKQQVAWQPYRTAVQKNPAGGLVQAIREQWAPPPTWQAAQERVTATARRAEEDASRRAAEEARRRAASALPPEDRVDGPLAYWIARQRLRGQEPDEAEIERKRAALIVQMAAWCPAADAASIADAA
jgi:hypothetical protein